MLLRMALDTAALQYELLEVPDGRVALDRLLNAIQPLHLIITDFVVPGMDFEQLLSGLESVPALRDVPVIVMSGMRDAKLIRRMQGRVADYLTKPANLDGWREIGQQLKRKLQQAKGAEGAT